MNEANPQRQYQHQPKQHPQQPLTKQKVLSQIQHLKKVILNIEERQLSKTKKIDKSKHEELQDNQYEQLKNKTNSNNQSRLQFGSKFFKDVNQTFRARMVNRKHKANDESIDNSTLKKYWQEGQEQKSIIQLAEELNKADSSNFVSERPDSQQEDCPATQLFTPAQKPKSRLVNRSNNISSNKQFQFKKVDYIPALQQDNHKFHSYVKDHKAINIKNKFQKEQQSTTSTNFRMMNVSSQPEISKKKTKPIVSINRNKVNFEEELFKNTIHKDSPKQQFIAFGQSIFHQYISNFNATDKFTIKKYKNCSVFSLLPHITKAAIWYYNKQLFIGNISLNESGKFQRNGPGIQIVKDRHKYNGYFVNSKKNGRGKIIYQNGDQYDGQWYEGQIYGFGRFKEGKTGKSFEGFWKNGQFCSSINNNNSHIEQFKFP